MSTENTNSENTKDQYVYYKMNNKWNIGKLKGQDDQYLVVDDKGEDLAIDKSKKHLYEFKNSNNQKYAVEQVRESLANVGIGKNALQDHELERLSKGEELHYVNSYKNSENKLVEGSSILEMRYGTNGVEMNRQYKRNEALDLSKAQAFGVGYSAEEQKALKEGKSIIISRNNGNGDFKKVAYMDERIGDVRVKSLQKKDFYGQKLSDSDNEKIQTGGRVLVTAKIKGKDQEYLVGWSHKQNDFLQKKMTPELKKQLSEGKSVVNDGPTQKKKSRGMKV